ncbi:GNAT family N-acetyltransferase [Saccharopolyspora sp. K220]|uniref:GNAT family N-acetyltransferase n=1 Tax=Saccharopolyspora soli TaxID=2926618 RepID=UPI001F58509E|nr:GNAT family N-acetyltransferase [Saccharopolyspora soli]MCI2422553.1 GNAT family N-acetyltransferase [Saccharopolyspora soli]
MTTATRLARPEDHTAALDVWRRANTARDKTPGPERIARVQAKLAAPAALVVVAERAGKLVGMALAEPGRDRDGAGEVLPGLCHISMVFVCPDHWGNRVGQLLLDAVSEQAVRQGHTLLQLWTGEGNQRALRLYDRAGFQPSGRTGVLGTGERIIHLTRLARKNTPKDQTEPRSSSGRDAEAATCSIRRPTGT